MMANHRRTENVINCGEYGHISRECSQEKRPVWGFVSSRPRPSQVRPDNTDEDLGSATGLPPFDGRFSSSNPNTEGYGDNVEGQSDIQEVRNQEDEPEVREIILNLGNLTKKG